MEPTLNVAQDYRQQQLARCSEPICEIESNQGANAYNMTTSTHALLIGERNISEREI